MLREPKICRFFGAPLLRGQGVPRIVVPWFSPPSAALVSVSFALRAPRGAPLARRCVGAQRLTHTKPSSVSPAPPAARARMLVSPASTGVPVLMACAAACCRHPCLCPQPLVPPHFPVAGRDPRLHQCHLGRRRPHRCRRPRRRCRRRRPWCTRRGPSPLVRAGCECTSCSASCWPRGWPGPRPTRTRAPAPAAGLTPAVSSMSPSRARISVGSAATAPAAASPR